jgi:hypothetical protein
MPELAQIPGSHQCIATRPSPSLEILLTYKAKSPLVGHKRRAPDNAYALEKSMTAIGTFRTWPV